MEYIESTISGIIALCEAMQANPIGALYLLALTAILADAYVKRGTKS
jgi:hypothetical protein